ncbi:hypothetical protein FAUST_7572 [Fusarium austroamericanum]|uniref:Uncharacterized protein n=1 Tax=Fusarium austroamericanum TaxID=282268 RepID=A0AAN5Z6F1_FUSAU|nr:hypothetical protein FAUST_7572 [Fusarium austroamericanum]
MRLAMTNNLPFVRMFAFCYCDCLYVTYDNRSNPRARSNTTVGWWVSQNDYNRAIYFQEIHSEMPPIKIEDDGQSHSTQPATNSSTTARVVPHVVKEGITSQRDDISTITDLQKVREWRINGHEAVTSHDVEIISTWMVYHSTRSNTERDVHLMSGPKLFGYWRGKGGRPWAAGIPDDICQLLKILDEKDGKLEVQFFGCAKSKSEWWESDTVKETSIELWEEWVQARDTVEPGQESN